MGQNVERHVRRGVPVGELWGPARPRERAGLRRLEADPRVAVGVGEVHHCLAVQDHAGRQVRADVVAWLPGGPNFVIEIDSAPNPASAEKLVFARDAGAFPLWVRFGKGGIETIDGVSP
ncbi:hypothetical protein [Streptomyces sp. NPDC001123]